jgi:hypothetical protein
MFSGIGQPGNTLSSLACKDTVLANIAINAATPATFLPDMIARFNKYFISFVMVFTFT